jgi:integrase
MGVVVRQKEPGRGRPWWVFISHDGKRTSKRVGDKKAAEKVASEIRAKLKIGEFDFGETQEQAIPLFQHFAQGWIETTVPATCKASTVRDYQDILRLHVLPCFEDKRIDRITRGDVKEFLLSKVNKGYAPSTVSHMKDAVSKIMGEALDKELISANPALNLGKILKRKDKKADVNQLTADELNQLLETVQEHFSEHYTLFLLLARTGIRIGEALALKWGDIDFNGRFIEVKRSIVRGRISTPKSGKSRRVDMSPQLTEALKLHFTETKKKGLALGIGEIEFVFTNERGNPIDKDNWRRRVFNVALKKAGLRRIRIHDLRHTYATLRISAGHNIADVSGQLGHHSVKLTLDVYHHWIPGQAKSEVDTLDTLHLNAPPAHPSPSKKEKEVAEID